jgi:hypothetical protein
LPTSVARPLPKLVGEISDGLVVGVGAVVIKPGDDITMRRECLGEPGVIERVGAPAVGEHDERVRPTGGREFRILVKAEIDEEGHGEWLGRWVSERRWIEYRHRDMPVAIDKFDLSHPHGISREILLLGSRAGCDASGDTYRRQAT